MTFLLVPASTSTAHLRLRVTAVIRHSARRPLSQLAASNSRYVLRPVWPRASASGLSGAYGPYRQLSSSSTIWRAALQPNSGSADERASPTLQDPKRQKALERLRPVIESFEGPIDWAAAYGSGVIAQANASPDSPAPLIDFLISVPSPTDFHTANLRQNPSHYPLYARLFGPNAIAKLQDSWGAGMWYVTNVKIHGMEVKYGLISTSRLLSDLSHWDTLYLAGRLQKPVLLLRSTTAYDQALRSNLHYALVVSLLFLPSKFGEMALWEQIAGISYSGDPRMSIPGAENPQKVKNIVRGEGVQSGLREMYKPSLELMQHLGLELDTESGKEWQFEQPDSEIFRASLFAQLPPKVQRALGVRAGLQPGESQHVKPDDARQILIKPDFRHMLQQELKDIMHRPALTQSMKGLLTAGFTKSLYYSLAKIGKWWRGRQAK